MNDGPGAGRLRHNKLVPAVLMKDFPFAAIEMLRSSLIHVWLLSIADTIAFSLRLVIWVYCSLGKRHYFSTLSPWQIERILIPQLLAHASGMIIGVCMGDENISSHIVSHMSVSLGNDTRMDVSTTEI